MRSFALTALALASAITTLTGCAVVSVAGAVVGGAVSVGSAVVSTGVKVTGKVVETAIDAVTPGDAPAAAAPAQLEAEPAYAELQAGD